MAGIKVMTNIAPLKRKVSQSAFNRGRVLMASQIGADTNRFVPKGPPEAGTLRNSQVIAIDGAFVQWGTPYGDRQYYAPAGWQYTTPGTGPHWDELAKQRYLNSWTKAFVKGCGL